MPPVGFEPTISVLECAKTVRALGLAYIANEDNICTKLTSAKSTRVNRTMPVHYAITALLQDAIRSL
jgi:hypothetical protein